MHRLIVKLTMLTYRSEKTAYSHTFQPTNASHIPKPNPQMLSMLAKTANHLTATSLNFPFQQIPIRRLDMQHQTVSKTAIVVEVQILLSSSALVRNMSAEAETRSMMQQEDADAAGD